MGSFCPGASGSCWLRTTGERGSERTIEVGAYKLGDAGEWAGESSAGLDWTAAEWGEVGTGTVAVVGWLAGERMSGRLLGAEAKPDERKVGKIRWGFSNCPSVSAGPAAEEAARGCL